MTELRPCPACRRHVAVREVACPFCDAALPPRPAPQVVLRGRASRAAVFGAALAASAAGCSKTDEPTRPVPVRAGSADDMKELEHMLDDPYAGRAAVTPPADGAVDAVAVGIAIDAGVPLDAGPDADAVARQKAERKRREAERRDAERRRVEEERRVEAERQRLELERQQDYRHMAKPYGAPPARRRIV